LDDINISHREYCLVSCTLSSSDRDSSLAHKTATPQFQSAYRIDGKKECFASDKKAAQTFSQETFTKTVEIHGTKAIPEFPPWIILSSFFIPTSFAILFKKKVNRPFS